MNNRSTVPEVHIFEVGIVVAVPSIGFVGNNKRPFKRPQHSASVVEDRASREAFPGDAITACHETSVGRMRTT